ncbi:dipeptidyl aminopeptidase [Candidatus Acidianus copahuensis]|uniref:Dipeptidyl aminopeptidase n=1 Tax=Candidatus Acidianus copahuensis TaxID=1160895 RepID=A0A031LN44_9CREN|nr:prolyl oligopeptidase family serine peptidase [Candidatus Acidianus copahuensis]EZQ04815.1 dipeptidyl aminopeptidase [Candidatus Acidianus copahuensis]
MKFLVIHGKGSSPEKIGWLIDPLKEFGEVYAPEFDLEVKEGVEKALKINFDCIAGHSRGGLIALITAALKGTCVISISAPSDRIRQLKYSSTFPKDTIQYRNYLDLLKIPEEELKKYSAINYANKIKKALLIHGERDEIVEKEQSKLMCEEIGRNGGECELHIINMRHSPGKSNEKEIKEIIQRWINTKIFSK